MGLSFPLERVVRTLLDNALRRTTGDGWVRIRTGPGERAGLEIENTGRGDRDRA